jgi:lipoprotein-anchoring transpeptidase ErfK/SrfK
MSKRTVQLVVAITACFVLRADLGAQAKKRGVSAHRPPAKAATAPKLSCGDYTGFQVLLDRQGFSPGSIDGKTGTNFTHALKAFQESKKLTSSGRPDCDTWKALSADSAEPTIIDYTLTDADVKGPFEKRIPPKLVDQAKLESLGYQSATELIAERFHMSPALLAQLNRGVPLTAGKTIKVSRDESALRATRPDGTLVFFAPVSSGSVHDPLPPGDWKVTGVGWHPVFHYNPDLFWDAKSTDEKATIKAGPNNPVGVVWIALNLEHYGLHGTPEPGNIGRTESHGCVRLTNWDAARLAALVKPGTPVTFK